MEKSNVIEMLKSGVAEVVFTKKDGTERFMTCTLKEDMLPTQTDVEETIQKKTPNPSVLAVYDTEVSGWRSFRWDSVKTVNGESFVYREE